jgi:hypothetical protein
MDGGIESIGMMFFLLFSYCYLHDLIEMFHSVLSEWFQAITD